MSPTTPTTPLPEYRCQSVSKGGTFATLYANDVPVGIVHCFSERLPTGPALRFYAVMIGRQLSGQAYPTQAQAEEDLKAWHENRDPVPYEQHAVVPLATLEAKRERARAEKLQGKLDAIRAMATRSVPQCINLDAIDRILTT